VEQGLPLNGPAKRADAIAYDRHRDALTLMDRKALEVEHNRKVFDQDGRYNIGMRVRWPFITNGLTYFCCEVDPQRGEVRFMKKLHACADMLLDAE
jgi:hypothetical protein